MSDEKKGFFKQLVEKYDALCQDLGIGKGTYRSCGCMPVVRVDENGNLKKDKDPELDENKL